MQGLSGHRQPSGWRLILVAIASSATAWLVPAALAAAGVQTPVAMPLGNEADPYAPAVARMVRAIVQYTSWPGDPKTLRACIVGPTDHADDLIAGRHVAAEGVKATLVNAESVRPASCEIVYLGRLSIEQQRAITGAMRGEAVLTISENDPACRSRAMFCLLFEADALSFRLNLDSVASSRVRIDPRVLRMGAGDRP